MCCAMSPALWGVWVFLACCIPFALFCACSCFPCVLLLLCLLLDKVEFQGAFIPSLANDGLNANSSRAQSGAMNIGSVVTTTLPLIHGPRVIIRMDAFKAI